MAAEGAWLEALKKLDQIDRKMDTYIALAQKVEKHERILRGGNGEGLGLVATVADLKKTVEDDHSLLYGEHDEPGLKGDMAEVRGSMGRINKVTWAATSALVGSVVLSILELLKNRP